MQSLPPVWYVGQANAVAERGPIWGTSWVSVARAEDLAQVGSFVAASIAGEPVVVVRDKERRLRALANVCPHRGSVIAQGAGTIPALRCPYHGWTFRLDGELAAAPQMPGLDLSEHGLPQLAVDVWNGWVFVNLDPDAEPVASQLGALDDLVGPFELASMQRVGKIESELNVNWKLVVENFAESYHHATVHPETLQRDFPGHRSWVLDSGGEPWMWLDHESTNDEYEPFAVVLAYPSHMFTVLRGIGMDWIRLEATSPTTTRLVTELFLPPHLTSNAELVDGLLRATRRSTTKTPGVSLASMRACRAGGGALAQSAHWSRVVLSSVPGSSTDWIDQSACRRSTTRIESAVDGVVVAQHP